MNQEGHPKDIKSNFKGANRDIDPEISGADNDGEYFDSQNGRVSSSRGKKRAWEKIRGEDIEYNINTPGNWFCLGKNTVNDDKISFWYDRDGSEDPVMIINGDIVGRSPDFPWSNGLPIQSDVNENCIGGEIFTSDFDTPPLVFNVRDVIDSFNNSSLKYFDGFNISLYTVNLNAPLDIPIFTGLQDVGGGGGLPIGEYQYSLRFVNSNGDRTNWGPLTPAIPVLQQFTQESVQYPYSRTHGGPPNVSIPTNFAVRLKFRITNLVNYESLEIRRLSYNIAGGVDSIPQGQIIARLGVSPGEISIREFLDPGESNITDTLADNEEVNELFSIEKAKAIRYHDKRLVLMNIETSSRDVSSINFKSENGNKIFPIMQGLGKAGHNDPVNHAYYKNYTSGERFSFAVNLYDSIGGRSFALEDDDLKNFQTPNRRDPLDTESQQYSFAGTVQAANTNSQVTQTFEAFDLENAVQKTNKCTFKNILNRGSKSRSSVRLSNCPEPPGSGTVNSSEVGYNPYRPISNNDTTSQDHNYRVNLEVENGSGKEDYNPRGFAPNYYSKGVAIRGVENFPEWAKSFSVVRSQRAGRVVCQGLGTYSLREADFGAVSSTLVSKRRNELWFYSPDIASGLVNESILNDINTNPNNYRVQLISPLGFFSEMYNFTQDTFAPNRDRLVDLMTYARVIHDEGQINPTEDNVMGLGGFGRRYVGYNRYRNTSHPAGGGAFNVPEGGNKLIQINSFNTKREGRGTYYQIELAETIYENEFTGGVSERNFNDQGLKDWTEPFYILNIVQEGRDVPDQNINNYYTTGFYQKIESIIGSGSSLQNQSFELVDERWEDCIPALNSTSPMASDEVFITLRSASGDRLFMNGTFLSTTQRQSVVSDVSANGFHVTPEGVRIEGLYTHTNQADTDFTITFNISNFFPAVGENIIVSYNNNRPLRVFGGDSTVAESVFSPIDREATGDGSNIAAQFAVGAGFPFARYIMNPRIYTVQSTIGVNKIQDSEEGSIGFIRQLCMMFCAESRTAVHYAHSGGYPLQHFPQVHYVMRPGTFDDGSFSGGDNEAIANDNNMFPQYFIDYPGEYNRWRFGGFRFLPQFNLDYSTRGPVEFFSRPKFGFEERNKFCTAIVWSLPRAINQQDSPGLKTFLADSRFDIDDDTGQIVFAWDARTGGKGENLYAITEKGVCLLLTKKSILSNLQADDLTVTSVDNFINNQYWIRKNIGCNNEMWRGIAEGPVEIPTEGGRIERDALYFPNSHSVYRLMENQVHDIAKDKYWTRLNPFLKAIGSGYVNHVTAVFDNVHNEYWLHLDPENMDPELFSFAQDTGYWNGNFTYRFDQYLKTENGVRGLRNLDTFQLEQGQLINGNPIEGSLTQSTSVNVLEKEFIYYEALTGRRGTMKPTRVEFLDEDENILSFLDGNTFGNLYLKQYDGWGQQIPRKIISVSPTRDRIQERLLLHKTIHNFEEDFKIVHTIIQYKILK